MNKQDLVAKIVKDTGLTKAAATAAVESLLDGIKKALKKGTPVTFVITARRCLLGGVLIFPVTAPMVSERRPAFPRVAALTRTLRFNPLALDIADGIVSSGAATVPTLTKYLERHGVHGVRVIAHEDDLPEVALLVDWAWERMSASSRRLLAVLAHVEGDHVDLASLGLLEAPGNYACAMAIGEGQSIGNYQSYGGPHYGFLAARNEFVRRMPGRIVGETTDLEGKRGFVLTLQTREQHIRREKATSNITTNQTLLALAGLITLCWLGPEGLRELGETCTALAAHAKEKIDLPVAFERPHFKEVAFRTPIPARDVVARAREHGVHPGYPLGRDYPGLDDVLLVALTEKRTPADVDRLAEVLAEVTG